jgi:hypothetical protein
MSVLDKLDRVEYLLKHMPGRHDQQRHAPHTAVSVPSVDLTEQEFMTLHHYANDDYEEINPRLRAGKGENDYRVRIIDGVMERSKTQTPTELYRVGSERLFGKDVQVGDVIKDPAFVSTSTSRSYAETSTHYGGRTRAILNVPAGIGAIDMSKPTGRPYEKEVLLERGLKYTITDKDDTFVYVDVSK